MFERTPVTYQFVRNATARLTYAGKTILLDPMLSEKGALPSFAGVAPNPTVDLPVPVEDIVNGVDFVVVSHLHGDHFDAAAAQMLDKSMPLVTPRNAAPANPTDPATSRRFKVGLEAMGFEDVREIGDYAIAIDGITVRQVFARHGRGEIGDMMGGVNGLVFETEGWPRLYWAGDTILDEEGRVASVLERFKPDIVIAHTGGPVIEALSPELLLMDAAEAKKFVELVFTANADAEVVAVHMEALDHCFSTRADLAAAVATLDHSLRGRVHIPLDGESVVLA